MSEDPDKLKFLLDISTNIFMELDHSGNVLFASEKAGLIFRKPQLQGLSLTELLDQTTALRLMDYLRNVLYQNYPETFTFEFTGRFYNTFMYPRDNKVFICLEDITERRQLSHHLNQTRRRLEFAERTAKMGYWELSLEDRKFYWSAEMYRIFGLKEPHISTKRNLIREQILYEDLPLYKQKIAEVIKHRRPVSGQVRVSRQDGSMAWCQFNAGLIHDYDGEKVAGTFQDISNLAQIQLELDRARQQAEESNLAKSYFLAQASHDLRQPMQALNMFISALCDNSLQPQQMEIVRKIEASASNLKSLLDNLLDISKLDSGGMDYQPQKFDLAELLAKLCTEYQDLACLNQIKLRCRFDSIIISSDPLLIERIVRNLLSNAFKYSRHKITISCHTLHEKIYIRVLDDGSGINPEDLPHIFNEFYQSSHIPDNRRKGAGLGLNIVKKITGILNGRISVRSVPGKYTAFTLTLRR